ncbi:rhamnose ABC transporter substrate-binding protein [Rhodococcus sp. ACS1]|jgi:rhamnose transport system substrate-binding protein|uniref:Sugar transporter solute binding component n=3 Tax=Rhodococcus TaxID=1827 RepID=A0AB38FKZ4_RHOWR|nr:MULTISPECIES: rhamnose ABC transporter substrate-binding protein [Rhodococcus]AII07007.1 sugar ABC transporter substrate-binding protein [Rhodococcus opacus]PBC45745.1 rhamnose ABC transporter substrate-binding protein [Rhodococcus sp. ACS1]QSE81698.1 rhamnose ABC transporter substrate-binding protein [Rhodococcus koreensis]REE74423.1 monosaccharide ABC transporter substrate-binding protein (CUT2 family) [Rhodococcus wratislaviensis]WAM18179.1 rhamnose ABC transporter substrate-binding prot
MTRFRRTFVPLAGIVAVSIGLTACGGTTQDSASNSGGGDRATGTANPDAPIQDGLQVAFLPKQLNNPYSDIEVGGGKTAVEEFGGEYKLVGPNDASASSQVSYINTLIQQGQNVINIAANDPNAVCPSLNQARDAGIKVVTFDSDAAEDCRDLFINQATTQGVGETLAKMTSEQIGGTGKIAVLSATPNATNQNAWIEVLKAELASKPEYRNIELVATVYGNDDDQKSFQETQGLLQTYPDLKAIVSPTTVGIAAAARYISSSSYKGNIVLTGLGTPNQMREYVKNGTVKEFALWDPTNIGYLSAYAGAALASGQITGAEGQKFTAGKLGEYTIGAGGEVVLGPPTVFDANTIDQYNF